MIAVFIDIVFFILIQTSAIFLFKKFAEKKEQQNFLGLFQSRLHYFIFNSSLFISCLYLNIKKQLFCIPVLWASVLLILFCISFLLLPFINKKDTKYYFATFFCGLGFFINGYIILFGRLEYFAFIFINLPVVLVISVFYFFLKRNHITFSNALLFYPAFVLTPFIFLFQLIFLFKTLFNARSKALYISSSLITLLIFIGLTIQMNSIFKKVEVAKNCEAELVNLKRNPINSYLIELILGSHWKYHTELCVMYDGWRPPFHDPTLVIANKILFPYKHFASGTKLYSNPLIEPKKDFNPFPTYKKLYPDNATSFHCRCGIDETILGRY